MNVANLLAMVDYSSYGTEIMALVLAFIGPIIIIGILGKSKSWF